MSETRRKEAEIWASMIEACGTSAPSRAIAAAAELRSLWAREKLLEAVYKAAELCLAEDVRGGFALTKAIAALKKHDKENPR